MQSFNQPGPSIGFVSTQQSVQTTSPISTPGSIQQVGPSTPRTPPQIDTPAISVQPSTPIHRVSAAPISAIPQISVQILQVFVPRSGPTIQTTVQIPAGQASSSTVATSQPQFTYQPYQGQYQFGPITQAPVYQYQLYPSYTYQQPQQPQFGPVNPSFSGGFTIPNANPI